MKKITGIALLATLWAWGTSAALAQFVTPEFTKGGATYRYAWGIFLDSQLFLKSDDGLLQLLALRQGDLQAKFGQKFVSLSKAIGLWHAYQNSQKEWVSNGIVADLTTPFREQPQLGKAFASFSIGAPQLAAASDSSGRLQAVITGLGERERSFIYAVRDAEMNWHVMHSNIIPDNLSQPCCIRQADGKQMMLLAVIQGGEDGSRIVKYTLSPSLGGEQDTFRWSRELFPESLKAASFAAVQDDRIFVLFLQDAGGANVQAVERRVATGNWDFEEQRFEPSIPRELSRIAPKSMAGFLGQDGLPQVIALQAGEGEQVVVHLYRDEIGHWHNNGYVFNVRNFKQISGCADAQGYINLVGTDRDGRIWHGYRGERHEWRSHGFIFDSDSH